MFNTAVREYGGKRFRSMHCGTIDNRFYSYSTLIAYRDGNTWHVRTDYKTFSRTTTAQTNKFMRDQERLHGATWAVDWDKYAIRNTWVPGDYYDSLSVSF